MPKVSACLFSGVLATALSLAAAPASAQESAANADAEGDPIVVTGQAEKPPSRVVDSQAREITQTRGALRHNPLPRIEDRLCPGVLGLRRDAAELMIDRIRWNAERLDMWMADEDGCHPNLVVAFVDDGQAAIAELAKSRPWMFESMTPSERRALLAEEGPVRVWTTTALKSSNGMPLPRRESLDAPPVLAMHAAHSKIYVNIREDITQVIVLLDRAHVRGKTVIQLADYATMRGFAQTRPVTAEAPLDTVLTLFDDSSVPPPGLTDFDVAYLRALYEGMPNLRGLSKIHGVNAELKEVLEEKAEVRE